MVVTHTFIYFYFLTLIIYLFFQIIRAEYIEEKILKMDHNLRKRKIQKKIFFGVNRRAKNYTKIEY